MTAAWVDRAKQLLSMKLLMDYSCSR